MKSKKFSTCIVIQSMLQELRDGLLKKGYALRELLEVKHPDADAVLAAVLEIKDLLEECLDISDRWVTAHVVVGDKKKIISNLPVRKVSI